MQKQVAPHELDVHIAILSFKVMLKLRNVNISAAIPSISGIKTVSFNSTNEWRVSTSRKMKEVIMLSHNWARHTEEKRKKKKTTKLGLGLGLCISVVSLSVCL